MTDARSTWTRIALFVAVTYAFSAIFMHMAISGGEVTVVAALGGMWSPFLGVLVTRLVFPDVRRRGSLAGLGWGWGRTSTQLWSYALPILYVGATYVVVWTFGYGSLTDSPGSEVIPWLLKSLVSGLIFGTIFAFGEEVGWQGFLVPRLYRLYGFTRASLLRGIIWSVWHYPLLLGGVYGPTDTPAWYRLVCFTITMTAISFAFTWFRIRSGSLWTGVIMHAAHNKYIQGVFPGLTREGEHASWLTDEMGILTAVAAVVVAVVFWLKRHELRAPRKTRTPGD